MRRGHHSAVYVLVFVQSCRSVYIRSRLIRRGGRFNDLQSETDQHIA
jgi:hypothetical protein